MIQSTDSAKPGACAGRNGRKGARGNGELRGRSRKRGLRVLPVLSRPGTHPFDELEWERRTASISDDKGNVVFSQAEVEVPKSWSMLATNVVASKYFYGEAGTSQRESSVRQLVHRVARTLADWGRRDGYFAGDGDAETFYRELCAVCVNQYGSFNSPVWFNVGLSHVYGHRSDSRANHAWDAAQGKAVQVADSYARPQASACFIQSVQDTMEDIMRLAAQEAMLFKHGSGTGTDLSTLRSSRERLSGGGTPSGPLSFMRVYDQVAAVIKSGGKTRRAAKMQSLKVVHPDIAEFINCKAQEEKKAWALMDAGYDGSLGGEAYSSVMYQNSNLSVRVTDEFMRAVEADGDWETRAVTTGRPIGTHKARDLFRQIAEATHVCGDPGLQYDTTINRWHTCADTSRINASNPCSEYMFVDDSACNLASVNLMKFMRPDGVFDTALFRHVVRLLIVAQDIIVDAGSYPSAAIAEHSHAYRPLGLGYANLGALLMSRGLAYDSDGGRALAGLLSALMTAQAYGTSAEVAAALGPFSEFGRNRACMLGVLRRHAESLSGVDRSLCAADLAEAAAGAWRETLEAGERHGFRNAQATLLAPTGTIGFMMDCDTTGIEPDIALVKYKALAGGGTMKLVNRTVRAGLQTLGYTEAEIEAISLFIDERETIEGAPGLKPEHLAVFDCAFKPRNGTRCIPYRAHLRMMAAVQPFLSGAISKTINMPREATVEEIMQAYLDGWKLGLKAVAIYRDGSKRTQPVTTGRGAACEAPAAAAAGEAGAAVRALRRRLPATRNSITHKFDVAGHEGYLTVGLYEDGAPGELFITMAKEGSTVGGIMDAFGTAISLCLQYGVPLGELTRKFSHSRFEPSGFTSNPEVPVATSLVDYIFRWMGVTFPDGRAGGQPPQAAPAPAIPGAAAAKALPAPAQPAADEAQSAHRSYRHFMEDAPACDVCGAITVRCGACYRCHVCGNSMGCS